MLLTTILGKLVNPALFNFKHWFDHWKCSIGGGDGDNETKQSSQYIWIAVGCGVVTIGKL